jgi:hypothetical protein
MDLVFKCVHCDQELSAESSLSGSVISCPTCNREITIPEAAPQPVAVASSVMNPMSTSAAAKEERHFSVPVHDAPTESLIKKPPPPLEVAAKGGDKKIRIKTIKHGDCLEVGKDKFDEIVSETLDRIGEANIISISTIAYSHTDLASRQLMTDFGLMIVFRS